jgi:thiamine-phosphate pyrophosphorylase
MDRAIYRVLDANFNRAREAMRVIEDCARFILDDRTLATQAKALRDGLRTVLEALPEDELLVARNTPGDVGTSITSAGEVDRAALPNVTSAACKRLTEALRTIEEYAKIIAPSQGPRVEKMRYAAYTIEQRLTSRLAVGKGIGESGLYAIISSNLCKGSLRDTAQAIIAGGAKVIQLREKATPDDQFLALATELRLLTEQADVRLIINDRADIAALVNADGVHLGQDDLPVAEVRRLLRPGAIVGRSTHSLADVKGAIAEGADYIGFGAIYQTTTKANPIEVGTGLLRDVLDQAPSTLPIVAVGGITLDTLPAVLSTGARWVAVSSALCCADDIQEATAHFVAAMNR